MGRDRGGRGSSLRRKVAIRRPRKTLAIYCEGERTEPEYFEVLKRLPEVRDVAAVDLRIDTQCGGFAPLTLVRTAVDARTRAKQEEGEIDEFWCVFDVEWPKNHPGLNEAIAIAKANEINLAISNPCFELWLALHFKDHRGWLDNDDARRLRRSHDGQVDKGVIGNLYMPRREAAAKRAILIDRMHTKNATPFPHNNPSSGVYQILASLAEPEGD
jgi:hypothetical protein